MPVTIENVVKRFGEVVAVNGVSTTIPDGAFVTFLGPSGCGKTTLLRLLAGFVRPDAGRILLGDQVISTPDYVLPPERRGMGMVFQTFAVWPHMTVYDNVAYGLRLRRLPARAIRSAIAETLNMVKLTGYERHYPSELSGGQQQRVSLARAIIVNPRMLLLDEPLSNLDAKLRKEMWVDLREIQRRVGITFVYVTHDQAEALSVSDEIIVLNRGLIEQRGSPKEIYARPRTAFVAGFVGSVTPLQGRSADPHTDDDGTGTVVVDGGWRLRCRMQPNLPAGTPVVIFVRSEAAVIGGDEDAPGANVLTGTVETIQYFGDFEEITVTVMGTALRLKTPPGLWRPGGTVRVRLDPAHCVAFPAGTDSGSEGSGSNGQDT